MIKEYLYYCPGCNGLCASMPSWRMHRSSWRLKDPACSKAAHKRPRFVATGRTVSDSSRDIIHRMMGDGSNSGLASGGAPNPFLQPRDEVGVTVYTQFAIRLTQFSHSLYLCVLGLHKLFVFCSTTKLLLVGTISSWQSADTDCRFCVHGRWTTWAAILRRWIRDCTGMIASRARNRCAPSLHHLCMRVFRVCIMFD